MHHTFNLQRVSLTEAGPENSIDLTAGFITPSFAKIKIRFSQVECRKLTIQSARKKVDQDDDGVVSFLPFRD